MNVIKIRFHSAFNAGVKRFLLDILEKKYQVVECDNYDYYFAQESIYWRKEYIREVLCAKPDAIRIFFGGEAVYADLNLFDYAISLQKSELIDLDRILYLPFIELNDKLFFDTYDRLDSIFEQRVDLSCKTKFCNFIYSNPNAAYMRDKLFYDISKYKRVDSLGKHLKNVEVEDTRSMDDWDEISIELKKNYKFSIAAENASFHGYTSEKIITSFLARTIPIYWGNPQIEEEYNPQAFINIGKEYDPNSLIQQIMYLDNNDDAYLAMLKQPVRTKEQIKNCHRYTDDFYKKFYEIFENKVRMRPFGAFVDMYESFYMACTEDVRKASIVKRICAKGRSIFT